MRVSSDGAAPLRPFGVGELLDDAVRLVKRNARAVFTISAPFAVVTTVLIAVVQLATYDTTSASLVPVLWNLFVTGLFGTVLTGLLAPIFTGDLLGHRVSAGDALARLRRHAVPLVGLALVVAFSEEAGVVALGVGGVWLWGIWAVAAPALVVEGLGVRAALSRSYALVRNSFWRTWGVRALGWVVTTTLAFFVTLPFTLAASLNANSNPFDQTNNVVHQPGTYVTIIAVGRLLAALLTAPVSAAIDALLYVDLRMRREGMDLVLGLDQRTPAPVTAW